MINNNNFVFRYEADRGLWSATSLDAKVHFEQGVVQLKDIPGERYQGTICALHGIPEDDAIDMDTRTRWATLGAHIRTTPTRTWRLLPEGRIERY